MVHFVLPSRSLLAGRPFCCFNIVSRHYCRNVSFLGYASGLNIRDKVYQDKPLFRMKDLIDLTTESEDTDNAAIDIISDSEDEDLKRAIAMSLQDQHALETATEVQDVSPQPQQLSVTQTSGLAGLDRKAMEAERLARLKRKRGLDEDHETQIASRSRQVSPPARKRGVPHREALSKLPSSMTVRPSVSTSNPFDFSHPKVLLTSHPSRHTASVLTSISLRDIVSAPEPGFDLKSVLLSSFMADFDWLLPHFDTRNTSFVIVLHAQNAEHRQALQDDFAGVPNVRLVLPKCMGGSGNMHSKVMLLFFKSVQAGQENEICRIVITSANLTPTDWGVGGHMENVVFTVDVPKKDRGDDSTQTQFELSFIQQLRAMEVPEKVLQKLESFDLRATEQMSFVSSISQSLVVNSELDQKAQHGALQKVSSGNKNDTVFESTTDGEQKLSASRARVGLLALSDAVSALGLTISKSDAAFPPRLDFITSSLGNLSAAFVRQLYSAACGTLDPQCVLATKSKSKKLVTDHEDKSIDDLVQQNLRIYFPSDKTVRESKGGSMSAGTICFQRKWWNDNEIIRNSLYDCIGRRSDGILMHSKVCERTLLLSCPKILFTA